IYRDPQRTPEAHLLRRMNDAMTHRGPDDAGYAFSGPVGLAMRRLSIIDLTTGHQPIYNEDRTACIVFNGEIYNYRDLRPLLENQGHRFQTNTDTEVILHLYEQYGTDCVQHLNGMFAFAIWDERQRRLFIARDRLGKKPLYYALTPHAFIFASELKSILECPDVSREVDASVFPYLFTYGYVPCPQCIIKGVSKLPPAHMLTYQDGQVRVQRYWHLRFAEGKPQPRAYYVRRLRELLTAAVKRRLVSDVPLGAFLSGGIDSSVVVGTMSRLMNEPVQTFSIGFEQEGYDERPYARLVAQKFRTDHRERVVQPQDVVDALPKLVWHLDEPFFDSSIVPTYYVSQLAREHVTVALSGDGGDELFAGYKRYDGYDRLESAFLALPETLRQRWLGALARRLPDGVRGKRYLQHVSQPLQQRYLDKVAFAERTRWNGHLFGEAVADAFADCDPSDLLEQYMQQVPTAETLAKQQYADIMTYLPDDILVKVDRASMACSLEARAPLLDYTVVEFAATLPKPLRLDRHTTKVLLKEAMKDILPPEILQRKKKGFSVPVAQWLMKDLKPLAQEILLDPQSQARGYFVPSVVERLLRGMNDKGTGQWIWALLWTELWHRTFIKEPAMPSRNLPSHCDRLHASGL
ncbi:MAG: asparagine synthase (glutamine-hydrolyzing), partial [Abditibacteriales bacterium]|nr:asparagine synthase (glutamine-hydrolyzing) [Abditibacteriales bacterium]